MYDETDFEIELLKVRLIYDLIIDACKKKDYGSALYMLHLEKNTYLQAQKNILNPNSNFLDLELKKMLNEKINDINFALNHLKNINPNLIPYISVYYNNKLLLMQKNNYLTYLEINKTINDKQKNEILRNIESIEDMLKNISPLNN